MAKTAEFHTLLRNYRGIVGAMKINGVRISFDSVFFNYYFDDDTIQFNLASQEGFVTIPTVLDYKKIEDPEELLDDAVVAYEAQLEGGLTFTAHCFNARNHS